MGKQTLNRDFVQQGRNNATRGSWQLGFCACTHDRSSTTPQWTFRKSIFHCVYLGLQNKQWIYDCCVSREWPQCYTRWRCCQITIYSLAVVFGYLFGYPKSFVTETEPSEVRKCSFVLMQLAITYIFSERAGGCII